VPALGVRDHVVFTLLGHRFLRLLLLQKQQHRSPESTAVEPI
jgi:hypothetical protein